MVLHEQQLLYENDQWCFKLKWHFQLFSLKLMPSALFSYFTKNMWKNVFLWVLKVLFSSRLRCYLKRGRSDCWVFSFLYHKSTLSDSCSRVSQREKKRSRAKSKVGTLWLKLDLGGQADILVRVQAVQYQHHITITDINVAYDFKCQNQQDLKKLFSLKRNDPRSKKLSSEVNKTNEKVV